MSNSRYFDDEDIQAGGGGILDSSGLRDYERISPPRLTPEGVTVQLNCRRCNREHKITLEWPEVIVVAANAPNSPPVLPPGWQFSPANGTPYVGLRCNHCNNPSGFAIHLPIPEARQHVNNGVQGGAVSQQYVNQIAAQVTQQHQQRRG